METTGCRQVDVDGEGGVVRGWGYMGNGCIRGCRFMGNGGWTCWSNPVWKKPQTKTNMDTYENHKYQQS